MLMTVQNLVDFGKSKSVSLPSGKLQKRQDKELESFQNFNGACLYFLIRLRFDD